MQDLSGIKVGDTVRIQYDEENTEYDSGRKEMKLKTKVVGFVKRGKSRDDIIKEKEAREAEMLKSGY